MDKYQDKYCGLISYLSLSYLTFLEFQLHQQKNECQKTKLTWHYQQ